MLGISFASVQSNWKDNLNLVWVAARFVRCPLSLDWKENCVGTCQDLPEVLEWDPEFFLKIITSVRPGCIGIIQKPSSSCLYGRAHHFHAQITQDVTRMWSVLSCELCICSIRTNCKPQSLCWWHLQENMQWNWPGNWNSGIGFSILTVHLLTLLWQCINFWQKQNG